MAIRPHEYDEENAEGIYDGGTLTNTATTGANAAQILGSALAANTKYLIVARALFKPSNTGAVGEIRVQTDDDSDIESKSLMLVEPQQSATTDMISYLFPHSYTTASSPSDVEFQLSDGGAAGDIRIRVSSLFLLDLDAISAPNLLGTHYFDASDAGPTDASANWNDDAFAFDGLLTTESTAVSATGNLSGEGTTAPTSGSAIGLVEVAFYYLASIGYQIDIDEDSVGGTNLLSVTLEDSATTRWSQRFTIMPPSGGWTWQKINDLAIEIDPAVASQFFKAEIRVYDTNGRGYVEDIQAVSGDDFSKTADTTVVAQITGIDLLDQSTLINTYHFDASDAGPTDSGGVWANDADAFDGSLATSADKTGTTGDLSGEGTTAPTSGATIGAVVVRVTSAGMSPTTLATIEEDNVGGTVLGSHTWGIGVNLVIDISLTAPGGGWTWQKINDLAIRYSSTVSTGEIFLAEVLVYGADPTPEQLILGYGRCDIANTGRYFDISLHHAYDTSTSVQRARHRAEGEDGAEQRIVGFATRHKASSGTPDVTMYGASENAGGGQNQDGGGYLIALPTSLFADFVDDHTIGGISIDGSEQTIATTGSYTPTVTGNHLIFGRSNGQSQTTQLGGMWVDSTTTEIRTGDSTPTHNQEWDTAKDGEQQITFQRYSITTAETFNLQSQGAAATFVQELRWLIVVNLNPPASGPPPPVYPPFPRHQKPAVRM